MDFMMLKPRFRQGTQKTLCYMEGPRVSRPPVCYIFLRVLLLRLRTWLRLHSFTVVPTRQFKGPIEH